jgi:hypothetical protein
MVEHAESRFDSLRFKNEFGPIGRRAATILGLSFRSGTACRAGAADACRYPNRKQAIGDIWYRKWCYTDGMVHKWFIMRIRSRSERVGSSSVLLEHL